jgi:hypothetical protein
MIDMSDRPRYGITSPSGSDFLSRGGKVIAHHCPHQLAWLFPGAIPRRLPPMPGSALGWLWLDPDYLGCFDAQGDLIREAFRG